MKKRMKKEEKLNQAGKPMMKGMAADMSKGGMMKRMKGKKGKK